MTEKLNEYEITSRDGPFINAECNTKIINTLVRKINELVDAVNELQKDYDNVCVWVGEQKLKTPAENVLTKSLRMDKEFAEDECARLQAELERTRKALDVAVDALKYANKCIKGGCVSWETEIDKALEQITALEKKV